MNIGRASGLLILLASAACERGAATRPPRVPAWESLGNTRHATMDRDINPRGDTSRNQALAEAPPAAQRLLDVTNRLAGTEPNLEHTTIVDALQRLADAIELVAPGQTQAVLRVRQSAQQLDRSGEHSTAHADLVRAGLEAAARALRAAPIPGGFDETNIRALRVRDSADAVARAASALDPGTELMKQYDTVQLALRESTRAVYAALGEPEPALATTMTATR